MLRSIRHLVSEARQRLALDRISRHFDRLFQCVNRIPSLFAARLPKTHSVSHQSNLRGSGNSVSTIFQSENYYVSGQGGNGGSPSARTRRARCRTQVLQSSSSHLMTRQVVTVLRQVGLKPYLVAEDRLTVTWPTETNLDRLETQEPLSVELQIYRDQGMKFRRLSGPESLFRWKLQEVLSLVYAQCGW
ncbi:hypothetical protein TSMEX_008385 [Taenia solium]|eukprot:TsM_000221700 transcript=TsM_000221700 gene=TsM_000221700